MSSISYNTRRNMASDQPRKKAQKVKAPKNPMMFIPKSFRFQPVSLE
jgi:hypothetical protein